MEGEGGRTECTLWPVTAARAVAGWERQVRLARNAGEEWELCFNESLHLLLLHCVSLLVSPLAPDPLADTGLIVPAGWSFNLLYPPTPSPAPLSP